MTLEWGLRESCGRGGTGPELGQGLMVLPDRRVPPAAFRAAEAQATGFHGRRRRGPNGTPNG